MKLRRIPWREVTKMFRLGAVAVHCAGCKKDDRELQLAWRQMAWFVTEDKVGPYCPGCAAKLSQAEDTSRSVTQFYSNTQGTQIEPEHLEE